MVRPINLSIAVGGRDGKGDAWVIQEQSSVSGTTPTSLLASRKSCTAIPCIRLHGAALASPSFPDSSRNKRNHTLQQRTGPGTLRTLTFYSDRRNMHQASNCEVSWKGSPCDYDGHSGGLWPGEPFVLSNRKALLTVRLKMPQIKEAVWPRAVLRWKSTQGNTSGRLRATEEPVEQSEGGYGARNVVQPSSRPSLTPALTRRLVKSTAMLWV